MKPFYENKFDSIQALRGLAAVFVLFEHIRFLNCGAFGVDIFFCISGFMIMLSTQKSTEHFLSKRAVRILPLYYSMTIGTFCLLLLFPSMFETTKADPVYLIKSLLFIPFDIGDGAIQPLLRIGWTVNYEIFFYLLFFIAMKISYKYRGLLCSALILCLVGFAQLSGLNWIPLTFYGNPILIEFILGMITYILCSKIYVLYTEGKNLKFFGKLSLPVALVIYFLLAYTKQSTDTLLFSRLLVWGLPCMFIVICFFLGGLYYKIPKLFTTLGNISFSIYLTHYYPILLLDRKIFDFSSLTVFSGIGAVVSLVICILLAYVCWYFIERNCRLKV